VSEREVEDRPALARPRAEEEAGVDPERPDRRPEAQAETRGPAQVSEVDPALPRVAGVEEEPPFERAEERGPELGVPDEVRRAAEVRAVLALRPELALPEAAVRARSSREEAFADGEVADPCAQAYPARSAPPRVTPLPRSRNFRASTSSRSKSTSPPKASREALSRTRRYMPVDVRNGSSRRSRETVGVRDPIREVTGTIAASTSGATSSGFCSSIR
jgi:hypothetical protein